MDDIISAIVEACITAVIGAREQTQEDYALAGPRK